MYTFSVSVTMWPVNPFLSWISSICVVQPFNMLISSCIHAHILYLLLCHICPHELYLLLGMEEECPCILNKREHIYYSLIAGMYGLPSRCGKLKDLSKFDATFFGVHPKQANVMDPQLRILHEVTYETLIDAGNHGYLSTTFNNHISFNCSHSLVMLWLSKINFQITSICDILCIICDRSIFPLFKGLPVYIDHHQQ